MTSSCRTLALAAEMAKLTQRRLAFLFRLNLSSTAHLAIRLRRIRIFVMLKAKVIVRGQLALGGQVILGNFWGHAPSKQSVFVSSNGSNFETNGTVEVFEGFRIFIDKNAKLAIGSGVIGENCTILCARQIEIGQNVRISKNVIIRDTSIDRTEGVGYVKIGDNVTIGKNTAILNNVKIGDNAVIDPMTVVNSDVQAGTRVAGIPARLVHDLVPDKPTISVTGQEVSQYRNAEQR